ncbi:MAG TPA: VWA domain-containing protein [Devosia sp.]|nr:VWA domain-containing protein [Devosia sp.]
MIFIWQDMLWLLLLVPALVALYIYVLRRRKRATVQYANLTLIKAALGKGPGWRRHVPPALLLAAIAVLIIAVARPAAVVSLNSSRATVILAMDVSGSMGAEDVSPTRMAAAQVAAKDFITSQPATVEIGIVAFASVALLVQAPTIERQPLLEAIERFELRRGTAVGSGVLTSLHTIFPETDFYRAMGGPGDAPGRPDTAPMSVQGFLSERQLAEARENAAQNLQHEPVEPGSYQSAVIVLLTDGATTVGPNPIAAGQMAADWGVRVYTVGFGSDEGGVVYFGERMTRAALDAPTLQEIAKRTGGEYFEATSAAELTRVYNSLSTKLVGETKLTEIAFIFAGVGALFAIAAGALSLWWFGRLT